MEIEEPTGKMQAAPPPARKPDAAIDAKQKELDALKADTRHYWKNVDTGEIMKQIKDQLRNPIRPGSTWGKPRPIRSA